MRKLTQQKNLQSISGKMFLEILTCGKQILTSKEKEKTLKRRKKRKQYDTHTQIYICIMCFSFSMYHATS